MDEKGEVTVIADEKLGGVEREYAEVKRKARKGETVRVFGHVRAVANGVFRVDYVKDDNDGYGETIMYTVAGAPTWGTPYGGGKNYVVLEPTDIVRIDGVRYRLVERKAKTGELVIVTKGDFRVNVGQTVVVTRMFDDGSGVAFDIGAERRWAMSHAEYAVLEPDKAPVTAAPALATPPQSDLQRTLDGLTEAVVGLTRSVTDLTRRVTELERPAAGVSVKVASGPVNTAPPSFAVRKPEPTRDEIVERAKRDVEELVSEFGGKYARLAGVGHVTVEFVVNREKRTVAALLRRAYIAREEVRARGTAKCSPDDVFNVHIGKAVALRRALGLDVPAEYVTAPQPTEVRAGDIVKVTGHAADGWHYYDIDDVGVIREIRSGAYIVHGIKTQDERRSQGSYYQRMQSVDFRVIDDSRTEVTAA